ncbi:hypothetical protein [Salmonella enterica]|uniref:hypothetical protein n=1 Tax=Salmonella enterica TaxID=28901 RepID=UPI003A806341
MFKRVLKSFITPFEEALKAWDVRTEQSIKAGGTTPVYDRYDPAHGLHSEPNRD